MGTPSAKRRRLNRETLSCGDKARWMASRVEVTDTPRSSQRDVVARPALAHIFAERGQARQRLLNGRRPAGHKSSGALALLKEPFVHETRESLADRDPGNIEDCRDLALGRQSGERLQTATGEGSLDLFLEPKVKRRRGSRRKDRRARKGTCRRSCVGRPGPCPGSRATSVIV